MGTGYAVETDHFRIITNPSQSVIELPIGLLQAAKRCLKPAAPAAAHSTRAVAAPEPGTAPAGFIPNLHVGATAVINDDTVRTATSAQESWKLTSVSYISSAQANAAGPYGDLASSMGSTPPAGSRYLVLGLTVTNTGTAADTNLVLSMGNYFWVTPAGKVTVLAGPTSIAPEDGSASASDPTTPLVIKYSAGTEIAALNSLNPGQSASGYAFLTVPDTSGVLAVAGNDGTTPLLTVDPGNLIKASVCPISGKSC